jgi:micrococcal nuclease
LLAAVLLAGAAVARFTGGDGHAPGPIPGVQETTPGSARDEPAPTQAPGAGETAPVSGRLPAKVLRVVDGDTVDVELDGRRERVRLIGVDTPEVHGSVEHYGEEASAFAKERLTGAEVSLELDAEERDRYGRLLAYLWLGDEMFNETLVREGYAQVMTVPPNVKYADRFVTLEREAREAGRGLWGDGSGALQRRGP